VAGSEQLQRLRVGHGEHDCVGLLAVDHRPRADPAHLPAELDGEPAGQLGDEPTQPRGSRPTLRPRRTLGGPAAQHGELGRPRPGEPRGLPPPHHLFELRVPHREVGGTEIHRAAGHRRTAHPPADLARPFHHPHRHAGSGEPGRARRPGDARSDHHDRHAQNLVPPSDASGCPFAPLPVIRHGEHDA
jgi:hypothetical protein